MSEFRKHLDFALDRMKRANDRGTGCHLTREMIAALGNSIIGQEWDQPKEQHRNDDAE